MVLVGEDVFVRPGIPVGDRFPPWCAVYELCQRSDGCHRPLFERWWPSGRLLEANYLAAKTLASSIPSNAATARRKVTAAHLMLCRLARSC